MRSLHVRFASVLAGTIGLFLTVASSIEARQPVQAPVRHEGAVTAIAYSPDGRLLASGGDDQSVSVIRAATGKEIHRLRGHRGRIAALAFSPDGKVLASGSRDTTVSLWDAETGQRHRCEGHERTVLGVTFAPDGRFLASASYDGTVRLWRVASGKEVLKIEAHLDAVSCVCFSPDGKLLATGGYDCVARVWAIDRRGATAKKLHQLKGGRTEITGVTFCAGGRFLIGASANGNVLLWDVPRGELVETLRANVGSVLALACSADGRTLAVGGLGGQVELYETATGRPVGFVAVSTGEFDSVKFTPQGGYPGEARTVAVAAGGLTVAAGGKDGRVHTWDVSSLLCRKRPAPEPLQTRDLESLWQDLGNHDPAPGYRAVAILASRPKGALPFLKTRLRPAAPAGRERISRWIVELDSARFNARQKASDELEACLEAAEPLLRATLEKKVSLELRRRIERLLQPLEGRIPPVERLRAMRALLALERMGTAEARELLERLADGDAGMWLTREARLALSRLPTR